ncbi:hypothetical protein EW145_g7103 [Phellinidium pouzarii]|uniref:Uncharacterized protein n=1 Tax=Phellinidium pouzarii TaxID=167371 RepID=A0A4S4KQ10_9AGAM|nr:hypothetical protein EW145_g7103 [Phellinidium pouzarii]
MTSSTHLGRLASRNTALSTTMTDAKTTTTDQKMTASTETPLPLSPPPLHPGTQHSAMPGAYVDSKADSAPRAADGGPPQPSPRSKARPLSGSGILKSALSKENRRTARRFFSAYAQAWVGLSPIWLMGEALTPGTRVGTQFNKGRKRLVDSAEDVRRVVSTSGRDVVVIIDEKLRGSGEGGKQIAERTAEVLKAAGENAILVVTTSLDKLSAQFSSGPGSRPGTSKGKILDLRALANDPTLKASLQRHGRDALVLLDGALAHPVVVTGVAQFARSRGLPHADALLRLARLGLGRILAVLPEGVSEDVQEGADERLEASIEEIDAEELEKQSSTADRAEAESVGRAAETAASPKVEGEGPGENDDPYMAMKKNHECLVM